MGATERIAVLMKTMSERDKDKAEASATLDKYAGRCDGAKWRREDLYDRAGLR
jgi:hypothetical protein